MYFIVHMIRTASNELSGWSWLILQCFQAQYCGHCGELGKRAPDGEDAETTSDSPASKHQNRFFWWIAREIYSSTSLLSCSCSLILIYYQGDYTGLVEELGKGVTPSFITSSSPILSNHCLYRYYVPTTIYVHDRNNLHAWILTWALQISFQNGVWGN